MTVLPRQRVQCDRCVSVFVLTAKRADHWGAELHAANWVARRAPGGGPYHHACWGGHHNEMQVEYPYVRDLNCPSVR
jgi:hypothetical protein